MIFINDLQQDIVDNVLKFADDMKLFRQVSDSVDTRGIAYAGGPGQVS